MLLFLALFCSCVIYAVLANRKLSCVGNHAASRDSSIGLILLLVAFACISGSRYNLGGTAYYYYEYFYHKITGETDILTTIIQSMYEAGYTAYVYICSNVLHLSYNGSLLVESVIFYLLMYLGLRKYVPNWGIFLMFFMYKMFFYVTFVAMRQALTVAGFFLILKYLEERKLVKNQQWNRQI